MENNMYTEYLIELCKSVIENRDPQPIPEDIDCMKFFEFCVAHKLENIAYSALQRLGDTPMEKKVWEIFGEKYQQGILNDAAQHYYLDMVTDAFNKNNINFVVMKGMVMKNFYPSSDLRQCADMDIFVGPQNALRAKEIMKSLGFENHTFGSDISTDNYSVDKFSYVELHKKFISDEQIVWRDVCNKISERFIHKKGCEYVMSDEDFYLFMICHIAKHMKFGGVGIRAVLDVWVYLRQKKEMDFKYIDNELEKCGLSLFYGKFMKLYSFWFNSGECDEETRIISEYVAQSGWDGVSLQWRASGINTIAGETENRTYLKFMTLFKSAFLKKSAMEAKYPVLKRHPVFLPLCWIHRGIAVVIGKRDTIKRVAHQYEDIDLSASRKINEMRSSMGL